MDIPSGIPAPNFIPNVEKLAATNPDLVVQWPEYGANIVEPITNAGLPACSFPTGTEQKARDYRAMVATAMGKRDGPNEVLPKKMARSDAGPKLWERADRERSMTRAALTGAALNSSPQRKPLG